MGSRRFELSFSVFSAPHHALHVRADTLNVSAKVKVTQSPVHMKVASAIKITPIPDRAGPDIASPWQRLQGQGASMMA